MSDLPAASTLAAVPTPVTEYPLDPEHWKLRAAVFGVFFGVAFSFMVVVSVLVGSQGVSILGILGGLVFGYLASALAERSLKGRWRSSRTLRLDREGIEIRKGVHVEQIVPVSAAVTTLRWKFRVSKRARVPKGWWLYACSLATTDRQITVYTFLPPKDAEVFARDGQFPRLYSKREREKLGPAAPQNLRQAGEERRLREAEEHRWLAGGEMTAGDFTDFLDRLDRQYAEWTPIAP
jgi:hypothetical protein